MRLKAGFITFVLIFVMANVFLCFKLQKASGYNTISEKILKTSFSKTESRYFEFSSDALTPPEIEDIIRTFRTSLKRKQIKHVSNMIYKTAKSFNIDPALILAVIAVESEFRHKAVSHMDARGLMQLRPFTAKALSRELKIHWSGKRTLFNPHKNILLGTYYLKKLKKRFKGNPKHFLTAYNAGPTLTNKLIRRKRIPRKPKYYTKVITYYKRFSI